jgi:hypothetical protein
MNQLPNFQERALRRDVRQFLVVTPTHFASDGRNYLQAGSRSLVLPSGDDVTLKLTILLYSVRCDLSTAKRAIPARKERDKSSISNASGRYVMTSVAM